MKALTISQPWASLIAEGVKTIETRSRSTKYRGPLAIHAGKVGASFQTQLERDGWDALAEVYGETDGEQLWHECAAGAGYQEGYRMPPFGAVIAMCELVSVVPSTEITWRVGTGWNLHDRRIAVWGDCERTHFIGDDERPYGDFTPGRHAWLLADIKPIEPVAAKGGQGLWNLPEDLREREPDRDA